MDTEEQPATTRPELVVEKGIPMPTRGRGGPQYDYPFARMKVGDSFLVPVSSSSVEAAAHRYGRVYGRKFASRFTLEGMRIWRTK